MGYSIFKFGSLYLGGVAANTPQKPGKDGDTPLHNRGDSIEIGETRPGKEITWIKPDNMPLLIADRELLKKVSWFDLNANYFVLGTYRVINGHIFRCRLLQVGDDRDVPNEWDQALKETNKKDALWHWRGSSFLGNEVPNNGYGVARGLNSSTGFYFVNAEVRRDTIGFRPALEFVPSAQFSHTCVLEGQGFYWSNIPGGEDFCPILQPVGGEAFTKFPNGYRIRMYTFTRDGQPIRTRTRQIPKVEKGAQLQLTDRYYGDEYLVPWTISNGVAVADRALFRWV